MELIYLVIILIIMLLAVSDLMTGITNNAVTFLNSVIGSKALLDRTIMTIVAINTLVGVITLSSMTEVVRSKILHSSVFNFSGIMTLV